MNNMNVKQFIEFIVNEDNVSSILKKYENHSDKGFIFERLCDIVIKFGFCEKYPKSEYKHLTGNGNNGMLNQFRLSKYLKQKVRSGNSSGASDITLQRISDGTYIFISCKYPKTTEERKTWKNIKYYDVQDIVSIIDHNRGIYQKYEIHLAVPRKKVLLRIANNANNSSNHLTKYINSETVMDKHDLNTYFQLFKKDIIENRNGNWNEIYFSPLKQLNLRFHQEMLTCKTCILIAEGNKLFLWGCKCRCGKTYMLGGLIVKQLKVKQKLNVLIITPAPTETTPQFTDDLFLSFEDFSGFKIHDVKGSRYFEEIKKQH